jgi:hypothetical protein
MEDQRKSLGRRVMEATVTTTAARSAIGWCRGYGDGACKTGSLNSFAE